MADMMTFPNTWEEYEQVYGITDTEEIYTNGARLIPSFRVKQWLDHIAQTERKKGEWNSVCRGKACICSICGEEYDHTYEFIEEWNYCPNCGADMRGEEE